LLITAKLMWPAFDRAAPATDRSPAVSSPAPHTGNGRVVAGLQ
jgi:hypothetical protein